MPSSPPPHFGHTRHGLPVHLHVRDHLKAAPGSPWYDRANAWLALRITRAVGTMWCAYAFAVLDLLALPTAIHQGLYGIVQWTASFFLQLVLLSIIMVGQAVQGTASDARSAKTFEDTEVVLDRLDLATPGGLAVLDSKIAEIGSRLSELDSKLAVLDAKRAALAYKGNERGGQPAGTAFPGVHPGVEPSAD